MKPSWSNNSHTLYPSSTAIGIHGGNKVPLPSVYSTLYISSLTADQILGIDLSGIEADLSRWAEYPAIQDVNMSNHSINNVGNMNLHGYLRVEGNTFPPYWNQIKLDGNITTANQTTNSPPTGKQYFGGYDVYNTSFDLESILNNFAFQNAHLQLKTGGTILPTGSVVLESKGYNLKVPTPEGTLSGDYRGYMYLGTNGSGAEAFIRFNGDTVTSIIPDQGALIEINADSVIGVTTLAPSRVRTTAGKIDNLGTYEAQMTAGTKLTIPYPNYRATCVIKEYAYGGILPIPEPLSGIGGQTDIVVSTDNNLNPGGETFGHAIINIEAIRNKYVNTNHYSADINIRAMDHIYISTPYTSMNLGALEFTNENGTVINSVSSLLVNAPIVMCNIIDASGPYPTYLQSSLNGISNTLNSLTSVSTFSTLTTSTLNVINISTGFINGAPYIPGGGGSPDTWYLYPALSNVDMGTNSISNINTITADYINATNYIQGGDGNFAALTADNLTLNGGYLEMSNGNIFNINGMNASLVEFLSMNGRTATFSNSVSVVSNIVVGSITNPAGYIQTPNIRGSNGAVFFTQTTLTGVRGISTTLISSAQVLVSSIAGNGSLLTGINAVSSPSIISSIEGLGTTGYISSSQLTSTVRGLATKPTDVPSTIVGLGTFGYLSSLKYWSQKPATSDVDLSNYNMSNVYKINGHYAETDMWNKWWSVYPCINNLVMCNNDIKDTNRIYGNTLITAGVSTNIFSTGIGYVSTLSTGSLGASNINVIDLQVAYINGAPYSGGGGGGSPSNWYLYAAQGPVSFTYYDITSVGDIYTQNMYNTSNIYTDILVASNDIATPSINGNATFDASNWSYYVAQDNVSLNNYYLTTNSYIQSQDVSTLNVSTNTVNANIISSVSISSSQLYTTALTGATVQARTSVSTQTVFATSLRLNPTNAVINYNQLTSNITIASPFGGVLISNTPVFDFGTTVIRNSTNPAYINNLFTNTAVISTITTSTINTPYFINAENISSSKMNSSNISSFHISSVLFNANLITASNAQIRGTVSTPAIVTPTVRFRGVAASGSGLDYNTTNNTLTYSNIPYINFGSATLSNANGIIYTNTLYVDNDINNRSTYSVVNYTSQLVSTNLVKSFDIITSNVYTEAIGNPNSLIPTPIQVNNDLNFLANDIFNINTISTTNINTSTINQKRVPFTSTLNMPTSTFRVNGRVANNITAPIVLYSNVQFPCSGWFNIFHHTTFNMSSSASTLQMASINYNVGIYPSTFRQVDGSVAVPSIPYSTFSTFTTLQTKIYVSTTQLTRNIIYTDPTGGFYQNRIGMKPIVVEYIPTDGYQSE